MKVSIMTILMGIAFILTTEAQIPRQKPTTTIGRTINTPTQTAAGRTTNQVTSNSGKSTLAASIPLNKVLADGYKKMNLKLPFSTEFRDYIVRKEDHYYILNDDIIVGDDYPKTQSYSTNVKDYKWPNAIIPIVIDKSIFDKNMQNMVISALNEMNTQLELSVVDHTNQDDYIRIKFSSAFNGAGLSPVGRRGGEQILLLAASASKATLWHELLHAAGIWHEQSRSDRDKFIRINEENLQSGTEHNFQIEPGNAKSNYDYCSIMHYPTRAFSKNNMITLECLSNNITTSCPTCMGQRAGFSPQDIRGLDDFYNEVSRFASHYTFVLPQSSWRYCNKCHAMFYNGYQEKGACPANGQHEAAGFNFVLPHDVAATATTQSSWRYCIKCYMIFFDGYAQKGKCALGGGHTADGYNFVLPHDISASQSAQSSWRFCNKCYTLFYDGYPQKGMCAAGGGHAAAGFNFVLPHDN